MPIMYLIQKEVDVYHRVPGSSGQKTDLFAFGEHPSPASDVEFRRVEFRLLNLTVTASFPRVYDATFNSEFYKN